MSSSELEAKLYQKVKPEISLLLPVYNEAETIETVILEFYNEICSKMPLEIVVAEDGSTDGTKEILYNLSKRIPMKLILGEKRKGYSKGLIDGLSNVNTKYVIFMDSDGQYLARDFWKFYNLRKKWDIISGWRVKRADRVHRKVMSSVFQLVAKILFKPLPLRDVTSSYRILRTEVAKEIARECKYMNESFWTEFTIRAYKKGFKIIEVPVTHRMRMKGSTNVYKPEKLLKIVFSQIKGLLNLWKEQRIENT